jgi:NADPH2:quinone reductase
MKAVVYTRKGGTEVLRIVEREVPEPGPGEVRVRMAVSGVNPTDCKTRSGVVGGTSMPFAEVVPNQDGYRGGPRTSRSAGMGMGGRLATSRWNGPGVGHLAR